jgi:diguanylate cyclase (GGDEF)-like protein
VRGFTTIRGRITLALSVVVVLTLMVLFGVGRFVIAEGFGAVEQRQAHERAALAFRQLEDERARITELARDYAAWDDMYRFAAVPTTAFIESAIPPDWLSRVRLDVVAVLSADGRVLFAKSSADGVTARGLPPQLMSHLTAGAPLVTHDGPTASHSGLVTFSDSRWIVASRPIVTSAETGKIRGTFVLGRRLDTDLLNRVSAAIGLPVAVASVHPQALAVGDHYEMQVTSADQFTAIAPLHDVYGSSIGWLTVRVPREIEAQRRITQYYLLTSLIIAAIALVAAVLFLLDQYIVRRVGVLARFLRDVDASGDLTARLADPRRDEIGRVATAVNELLGTLEHRNREIEEARSQACLALEESARKNQELEQANLTIARLAGTDDLTGLANRRMFDSRLDEQIARAVRKGEPFTVLLADIDHFKVVNDTYGHQTGDRVLVHVASRLATHTRGYDLAARYGGEEFTVLLTGTDGEEGVMVADRIRLDIEQLAVPGYDRPVTVSIGVAEWHRGESADAIMRRADDGLYQAKRTGRNRVEAAASQERSIADPTLRWRQRAADGTVA